MIIRWATTREIVFHLCQALRIAVLILIKLVPWPWFIWRKQSVAEGLSLQLKIVNEFFAYDVPDAAHLFKLFCMGTGHCFRIRKGPV